MPRPVVSLIHATLPALAPVQQAFQEVLPGVPLQHLMDDWLLPAEEEAGGVTPQLMRRMATLVGMAEEAGSQVILLTCTGYTSSLPTVQQMTRLPVLAIDAVLVEEAARSGPRVGVVATTNNAIEGTPRAVLASAEKQGLRVEVETRFCPEAFSALAFGDAATHDRMVRQAIEELAQTCQAVVLAQASMARVLKDWDPPEGVRVLSSPQLAAGRVKEILDGVEKRT